MEAHTRQVGEMKELFHKKAGDFDMIQDGMKRMKAFETKKEQMERELSDVSSKRATAS